MHGNTIKILQ